MKTISRASTEFAVYFLGTLCVISVCLNVVLISKLAKPDLWRDLRLSLKRLPALSAEDHVRGPLGAPSTVIEYSDYQCPYCRQMHSDLKRLIAERPGVTWVFRNRPLESIHPLARRAAVAAECANLQGKFWDFSDVLFDEQTNLKSESLFQDLARKVDLNLTEFNECLASGEPAILKNEKLAADALEIDVTPTLFVNGKRFDGAISYAELVAELQK
jgi:protein-disulfide isomerase